MIVVIVGSVYARGLRAPIRHRRGASPPVFDLPRPFSATNMLVNYVVDGLRGQAAPPYLYEIKSIDLQGQSPV